MRKVQTTELLPCPVFGKQFKNMHVLKKHMEIHTTKKQKSVPKRNPLSTLKKSQQYNRAKEDVERIKKALFEAPEKVNISMWNYVVRDSPYYYNKITENPLTEAEAMELIQNNNLVNTQILNISKF